MNPIDILRSEHRCIEQVLICFEKFMDQMESPTNFDQALAHEFLIFFSFFADKSHHGKEEHHLYRILEKKGIPRDTGPVGDDIAKHVQVRDLLANLESFLKDTSQDRMPFISSAREYIGQLSKNIKDEEAVIYPMAEKELSETDQKELTESFLQFERKGLSQEAHKNIIDMTNNFSDRFHVMRMETGNFIQFIKFKNMIS